MATTQIIKRIVFIVILLSVPSLALCESVTTKSKIGMEDMEIWKGGSDPQTFQRRTSTGGTVTMTKIGVIPSGGGGSDTCDVVPESYGGVGDGTNDDTSAVVAAYNALPVNSGTICFSNKLWTFNLTVLKSGVTLVGSNGNPHYIQQEGGYPGLYWQPYDVSKPVVTVGSDSVQVYNFSARDFAMSGVKDGATRGTAGLKIAASAYHNLSNFNIVGFSSYQLKVGDSTYSSYYTMAGNFSNFNLSSVGTTNGDVIVQENGTGSGWTTTQNFSNGIIWGSSSGTTNYVLRSGNNMYLSNVWVQVGRCGGGILLDTTGELRANAVTVEGTGWDCEVVTNTDDNYSIEYHMNGLYQIIGYYANPLGRQGFGSFALPKAYFYCPTLLGPIVRYTLGFVESLEDNATLGSQISIKRTGNDLGFYNSVGDFHFNETILGRATSGNGGDFTSADLYGVYATNANGVYPAIYGLGVAASVGVMGTSTRGYGGHFSATNYPGLYAASDNATSARFRVNLSGDNVEPIIELYRTNPHDNGTIGTGGAVDFWLRSDAGVNRLAGRLWVEWTKATDGNETAKICVGTMKNGVYISTDNCWP
jgi:hypothetical protein